MTLTAEQWEKVDNKYGNLMWSISYKISGDCAIASLEDNHADLQIAALEAIEGFKKKTGKTADEFLDTKLFDQYLKTCLWNFKNNKGSKIAKKYHLTRDTVSSSEYEDIIQESEFRSKGEHYSFNAEQIFPIKLTSLEQKVVDLVVEDSDMLKDNGSLNISKLSKSLHKTWGDVRDIIEGLNEKLETKL
jgi:hypothetical protein